MTSTVADRSGAARYTQGTLQTAKTAAALFPPAGTVHRYRAASPHTHTHTHTHRETLQPSAELWLCVAVSLVSLLSPHRGLARLAVAVLTTLLSVSRPAVDGVDNLRLPTRGRLCVATAATAAGSQLGNAAGRA